MKYFDWDEEKNAWLIANRGISFELCQSAIEAGFVLDVVRNKSPYIHQKKFILEIQGYAYVVPFVEDDEKIFFKTAYPSKKETKKYANKFSSNNHTQI